MRTRSTALISASSALLAAGDHDGAIAAYRQAGVQEQIEAAFLAKGTALFSLGQVDEAITALQQAGQGGAELLVEAWTAKGETLLAKGMYDEAIAAFTRRVKAPARVFSAPGT